MAALIVLASAYTLAWQATDAEQLMDVGRAERGSVVPLYSRPNQKV